MCMASTVQARYLCIVALYKLVEQDGVRSMTCIYLCIVKNSIIVYAGQDGNKANNHGLIQV